MTPSGVDHVASGDSGVMTCLQITGSHKSSRSRPSSYPMSIGCMSKSLYKKSGINARGQQQVVLQAHGTRDSWLQSIAASQ